MIAEDALCQVCELNDLPFTFNDILQKGESVIEKLETTPDEEQVPLTSYEPFFTECSSHDCCRTSLRIKHSVIPSMNQLLVGFLVI